ncbi:hypothetical protein K445DRAFT_110747 [Daldinia sp. EC12]|nr:hypothetical protein K445DRAFT_110747 [Daldinia sp. EC12]
MKPHLGPISSAPSLRPTKCIALTANRGILGIGHIIIFFFFSLSSLLSLLRRGRKGPTHLNLWLPSSDCWVNPLLLLGFPNHKLPRKPNFPIRPLPLSHCPLGSSCIERTAFCRTDLERGVGLANTLAIISAFFFKKDTRVGRATRQEKTNLLYMFFQGKVSAPFPSLVAHPSHPLH